VLQKYKKVIFKMLIRQIFDNIRLKWKNKLARARAAWYNIKNKKGKERSQK